MREEEVECKMNLKEYGRASEREVTMTEKRNQLLIFRFTFRYCHCFYMLYPYSLSSLLLLLQDYYYQLSTIIIIY